MDKEEAQQEKYCGWAVIELYGHSREVGYVTTVYVGTAAMFRVDVPEEPASKKILETPEWVDGKFCGVGTEYDYKEIPGKTRYLGVGAIYALNPCDETTARMALSRRPRSVQIVKLVETKELASNYRDDDEPDEDDDE